MPDVSHSCDLDRASYHLQATVVVRDAGEYASRCLAGDRHALKLSEHELVTRYVVMVDDRCGAVSVPMITASESYRWKP